MNKIEKQLKDESKQLLPSTELKNKVLTEIGINEESAKPKKITQKNNKLVWSSAISIACVLVISIVLAVVFVPLNTKKGGNTQISISKNTLNDYAIGAASAGLIIGGYGTAQEEPSVTPPTAPSFTVSDAQIDALGNCMGLIDGLMDHKPNVQQVKSDNQNYQKKMIISFEFLSGGQQKYIMYYNETLEEDDDNDGEIENSIDGIILIDDKEYKIKGEHEKSESLGECEYETKVTIYFSKVDYIVVEREMEQEENETENCYVYKVYKNKVLQSSFDIEIQNEGTEREIELEIKNGVNSIYSKFEYIDNKYIVKVYQNNNYDNYEQLEIIVEDTKYVIHYNGNTTEFLKP